MPNDRKPLILQRLSQYTTDETIIIIVNKRLNQNFAKLFLQDFHTYNTERLA